jgi:hypothetical protein
MRQSPIGSKPVPEIVATFCLWISNLFSSSGNRLEFRLQAERLVYRVLPPEGETPNDFIVSGRRKATCMTPLKKMLDAGCWMLDAELKASTQHLATSIQHLLHLFVASLTPRTTPPE